MNRKFKIGGVVIILLLLFYYSLPQTLFKTPYSTVLESSNGQLLNATIATDGQWRFPMQDTVPYKFEQAILHFEDEYFFYHPGVNPISIAKAFWQNVKAKKIKRGGSTLTMQVIRLSRNGKSRNIIQKLIETYLAVRLETTTSKDEILQLYAAHAPFGGNVVGLEAAAWRYYHRKPEQLSWGEMTTLAVLPNSPSLIHLKKNRSALRQKRNRLLDKLYQNQIIDETTAQLAKEEPIPEYPIALPQIAPHLLTNAINANKRGQRITSTINYKLQQQVNRIAVQHHQRLKQNEIYNLAMVVVAVETGDVLAYVGNVPYTTSTKNQAVDIITKPRSSGSILKPFLYQAMLEEGFSLPRTLIADIPTYIAGYTPLNFDKTYDGAVPFDQALSRSLNIPFVRQLQNYGVPAFKQHLQKIGFSTINRSADNYGLSLILGGGEVTLWDLCSVYGSYARTVNHFINGNSKYYDDFRPINYELNLSQTTKLKNGTWEGLADAGAIFNTFTAMQQVKRPMQEVGWQYFLNQPNIAWKTGTSFGHRDAWSVGITPEYVVGVWVGNADGSGRPGLTGVSVAGPILFEVFDQLNANARFKTPFDALIKVETCLASGQLATVHCKEVDTTLVPQQGKETAGCNYHQTIITDSSGNYRVQQGCYQPQLMRKQKQFVLPPNMAYYYQKKQPSYKSLPPYLDDCAPQNTQSIGIIYPNENAEILIPVDLNGTKQGIAFEATHQNPSATLFWSVNTKYIQSTTQNHQIIVNLPPGQHQLNITDHEGNAITRSFKVISE